jgi:hypothetical protein
MSTTMTDLTPSCELAAESLIAEQLEYFGGFAGRIEILLDGCANVVYKGERQLKGVKFPLCIIIEALQSARAYTNNNAIFDLLQELLSCLEVFVEESGFNYFEDHYLPNDLDTASSVARILGTRNENVGSNYDEVTKRNRISPGIIPTWLDTDEHDRWFVGSQPYHLDVLLNHWLTEAERGRPVDPDIILKTVNTLGLKNYWYLPPLYTPYLYSRLLSRMRISPTSKLSRPLIDAIKLWDRGPCEYLNYSNICTLPNIRGLLEGQPPSSRLDIILRYAIGNYVREYGHGEWANVTVGPGDHLVEDQAWPPPLYWSLGFTAFTSEPVSRAIVLLSLLDITRDEV